MIENIALSLISALFGGGLLYAVIFTYGRISYWRGMYETSVNDLDNALDRIAVTEKTAQAVADKYVAAMEMFKAQMERPVVAALKDEHVHEIASVLVTLVQQQINPNRVN